MPAKAIHAILTAIVFASACADVPTSPATDSGADFVAANASEYRLESSSSENMSELAVGSNASPVVGGKESAPCGWPSTVDVAGCTGTLIHPRVVTTAAHCLSRTTARVTFTAGTEKPGSFSLMAECTAGARGGRGGVGPRDWAYCVLPEDERVKKIPYTPPLVGCEAERYLKAGNMAWVVGFGATGGRANDYGVKREVEVKINRAENGIIDIGDREAGACYGDSGGPLYIKITDGTHDWGWRVAGSTSGAGGSCDCTCSTVYADIRSHVEAIEENEMIDVTPCTDAEGNWAPGPECNNFITNPAMGTGTYPDCTVQRTTEPIASCGEPAANTGAAGAAGGAAGSGAAAGAGGAAAAAGAGGAAGSGAVAAAGSGGSSGAAGTGSVANTAGAGATGATGATGAAAGAPGVGVGVMAASAGASASAGQPAVGSAGTTGSVTNAASAAGTFGGVTNAQQSTPEESGGCQAANVGARDSRALGLFGALLLSLSARGLRSRQRRSA